MELAKTIVLPALIPVRACRGLATTCRSVSSEADANIKAGSCEESSRVGARLEAKTTHALCPTKFASAVTSRSVSVADKTGDIPANNAKTAERYINRSFGNNVRLVDVCNEDDLQLLLRNWKLIMHRDIDRKIVIQKRSSSLTMSRPDTICSFKFVALKLSAQCILCPSRAPHSILREHGDDGVVCIIVTQSEGKYSRKNQVSQIVSWANST